MYLRIWKFNNKISRYLTGKANEILDFFYLHPKLPCHWNMITKETFNTLGKEGTPFIFIIDFEMEKPLICFPSTAMTDGIMFDIRGFNNSLPPCGPKPVPHMIIDPPHPDLYIEAFNRVHGEFTDGNSYLLNLTFPTPVWINLSLEDIFTYSNAPYRLLVKDRFVLFSPEPFIRIHDGIISAYPMKGTRPGNSLMEKEALLADGKELAEHITIVDLIRNDLNMVANDVRVVKFRYIEEIRTHNGPLLQTSSHIEGILDSDYPARIGDILWTLLPAGSITGAPKKKTVEIIRQVEKQKRGYYTGVFGYFDGKNMDSAVMIRFIERTDDGTFRFRSGGGLTVYSDHESEYRELKEKIYVPVV